MGVSGSGGNPMTAALARAVPMTATLARAVPMTATLARAGSGGHATRSICVNGRAA